MIEAMYKGELIDRVEKQGRYKFLFYGDNKKIAVGKIDKIELICIDCKKIVERPYTAARLYRQYVCQSCNKKGSRNPFYGKEHTQDFKDKLSRERKGIWYVGEANAFYGKKHTEEVLEKIRNHPNVSQKGKDNPFYGKEHTQESIDKIVQANLEYRKNLTEEEKLKIKTKQSESHKKFNKENQEYVKQIKRKAARASHKSQLRYKKNKIEQMFHDLMNENGIEVEYSLIMNYFQYDFGNKVNKVLIEINGDYWHANPRFYGPGLKPINETQKNKIARDKEKLEWAKSKGFKLLTVWEYDLYNNPESVIKEVKNVIKL
jgi:G:T-mismatch repair DNA endonuclease (very short patch repair protein)